MLLLSTLMVMTMQQQNKREKMITRRDKKWNSTRSCLSIWSAIWCTHSPLCPIVKVSGLFPLVLLPHMHHGQRKVNDAFSLFSCVTWLHAVLLLFLLYYLCISCSFSLSSFSSSLFLVPSSSSSRPLSLLLLLLLGFYSWQWTVVACTVPHQSCQCWCCSEKACLWEGLRRWKLFCCV